MALAASCHESEWHSTSVVGDSTARQFDHVTGESSTRKGWGFSPCGHDGELIEDLGRSVAGTIAP